MKAKPATSGRAQRDERGSVSIELVILLPALFAVMFLGMQAALFYHARTVAIAAAQEGAKAAGGENGKEADGVSAASSFVVEAGGDDVLTRCDRDRQPHRNDGHRDRARAQPERDPGLESPDRPVGLGARGEVDGAVTIWRRMRDERGSAAVEAAVGLPAFMLFVGLIIFGGRTATTHSAVESAAAEAARTASLARTASEATQDAKAAAQASLANQDIHCLSVTVSVDVSDFAKTVGEAGSVSATVECLLDLADLSVPGVPGSRPIKATSSSPLDTWRERG